jgi:hypothetical protein
VGHETRTGQETGGEKYDSAKLKLAYTAHDHPSGTQPGHDRRDIQNANDVSGGNPKGQNGKNAAPSFIANGADGGKQVEIYVPSSNPQLAAQMQGGVILRSTDGGKTMTDGVNVYPLPQKTQN